MNMSMIDLIQKLIDLINQLLTKRCECFTPEEYNQMIKTLDDIINKLQNWLSQAEAGTLGVNVRDVEKKD
jgi:ribonucleotide reductase beta subunit family protein with ferritin-like domain